MEVTPSVLTAMRVITTVVDGTPSDESVDKVRAALGVSAGSPVFSAALSCIHRVRTEGTRADRHFVLQQQNAERIRVLNGWLSGNPELLAARVQEVLGIRAPAVQELIGRRVDLPWSASDMALRTLSATVRVPFTACMEGLSIIPAGALSTTSRMNHDPAEPISHPDFPPVLFVHGLKHNETGWWLGKKLLWIRQLLTNGPRHGAFYSVSYSKLFTNEYDMGIDDYVQRVREKIEQIRLETGHDEVILVGHSLGGIISSRLAVRMPDAGVRHVFTLSSPFRGSRVANAIHHIKKKLGMSRRVIDDQLTTFSDILPELEREAREADFTGRVRHYCLASTTDELVSWKRALVTDDSRRQKIVSWLGHLGILFSPYVWHWIDGQLTEVYAGKQRREGADITNGLDGDVDPAELQW